MVIVGLFKVLHSALQARRQAIHDDRYSQRLAEEMTAVRKDQLDP